MNNIPTNDKELWKPIKGYPKYYISNQGRIWSEHTKQFIRPHLRNKKEDSYLKVGLTNEEGPKTLVYHRLLAEAFIPNPENKCCVNHKDGNKLNNNLDNLEWVTYSENSIHAVETGLSPIGSDRTTAILSDDDILEIAEELKKGKRSFSSIARDYNVDSSTIRHIYNKRNWSHLLKDIDFNNSMQNFEQLDKQDVYEIAETFLKTGMSNKEIAKRYGVSDTTIGRIRRREIHTDVTNKIQGDFFKKFREAEAIRKPGNTLLTRDQVIEICEKLSQDNVNLSKIAREYGLKNSDSIAAIYNGETWREISQNYKFGKLAKKKTTDEQLHRVIKYFMETNLMNTEIAKLTGVHKDVVKKMRNRQAHKHITESPEYKDLDFKKNMKPRKPRKSNM